MLTLADFRPDLVVAALNAYSMLGIEKDTPISELEDGPNISLSTTDKCDWSLEIDDVPDDRYDNGCQIYDVNGKKLAETITTEYGFGLDLVEQDTVLNIVPQTKNSVLFQELVRQISLLAIQHDRQIDEEEGRILIHSAKIIKSVASRKPDIFYGNWCGVTLGFQDPYESILLECYNEQFYISVYTELVLDIDGLGTGCYRDGHAIDPE